MGPGPDPADLDPPLQHVRRSPFSLHGRGERRRHRSWRRVLPVFIAMITLSAFASGVWFAYEQGVRQGLRLTPILVRAEPGPMKILPQDPGGLEVPNQDHQVFDVIGRVEPEPRVEQLLPPPEEPLEVRPPNPDPASGPAPERQPPLAPEPAVEVEAAAVAQLEAIAEPDPEPVAEPEPQASQVLPSAPLELLPAAGLPGLAPKLVAVGSAPEAAVEGLRIQLGAYRVRDEALAGWTVVQRRFRKLLEGLRPTIQRADLAAGTFYRLRAGPINTSTAAKELCRKLLELDADCLVVNP